MDPLFHYWFTLKSTLPWGTALLLFQKLRQNICAAESFKIQGDERGDKIYDKEKGTQTSLGKEEEGPKSKRLQIWDAGKVPCPCLLLTEYLLLKLRSGSMRPGENHCEAKAPSILCLQHTMSNSDVSANQSHVITEGTDHRDRQHTDVLIGSKCQCAASA